METHGSQFTARRLVGLGALFALMLAWMIYMVNEYPPRGAHPAPSRDAWSEFRLEAILSVLLVLAVNVFTIIMVRRHNRQLPEHERDWHGPDPHADRAIPAEAYSPSPIMRAAIRRTLEKQPS